MAKIAPFRGIRPKKELASQVAAKPYDVLNSQEARAEADGNPYSFYHISKAEIDLPDSVDIHDVAVYKKAAENQQIFLDNGVLIQDEKPCYYIYSLTWKGRTQTGLVCGSSVEDYKNDIIKKHEFTRPEKEQDRINHITYTQCQSGVVFLAYRNVADMDTLVNNWIANHAAEYDFELNDGVRHTIWVVNEEAAVNQITEIFASKVPFTYIADGHHRAASANRVSDAAKQNNPNHNGTEEYNYFITTIFPEDQLAILDYNRVVKDLNGMSTEQFLEKLATKFDIENCGSAMVSPAKLHEFGLYINNAWYKLTAKPGTYTEDPIGILDVSILQNNVLSGMLEIHDPRTDKRVDFIGGIRGLAELEKRVNNGEFAAAFSMYPVTIAQLFDIADSGNVMPPKSTWFEPKLRDGLVMHSIK